MRALKYLSVCSGIEAVSVAWQPLGWRPAMFAEIDPFCCWLLRSRYGASRPLFMPSPHDAPDRKEAKRRAAAIRNVAALPTDGDIINAGDFTKIGAADVGTIDLLAGGTPCQSFSIAGKRAGLDDSRGDLTIEFARLADRIRPAWLVWENVPGVLSIDSGRTFHAFLNMLVECGYGVAYRVLDAQYFGVPQKRRRVFVVGHSGGWRGPASVLLEWACLSGYPPPRREARQGATGGVEVGFTRGRFTDTAPTLDTGCQNGLIRNQLGIGILSSTDEISRCLNAGGMGRQDFETETLIAHSLSAEGFDASEDGTGRGVPMVPVSICTAHTQSNGSGFSDNIAHTLERGNSQAVAFAQNMRDEVRLCGRDGATAGTLAAQPGMKQQTYIAFSANDHGSDAGDIAPTLRAMNDASGHGSGSGQAAIAWTQELNSSADIAGTLQRGGDGGRTDGVMTSRMAVRRLTPRECERLQGFPDDYTLVEYRGKQAPDGPRYKALGNSMAVPVMRWIGQRIAQVDAILREQAISQEQRKPNQSVHIQDVSQKERKNATA